MRATQQDQKKTKSQRDFKKQADTKKENRKETTRATDHNGEQTGGAMFAQLYCKRTDRPTDRHLREPLHFTRKPAKYTDKDAERERANCRRG